MVDAPAKGVEALERAFLVLDSLTTGPNPTSLADIARHTGLYKSTILRLLVSLERFDYVVRQSDGRYRLGPATWRLGASYRNTFSVADVIRPELRRLTEETSETASFYVREGQSRICLYRVEPSREIRHSVSEGARMPLERGASGRVLLAFSADANGAEAAVRKARWAASLGERDPEVAAVSVPVFDSVGDLRGALSVSGLITRFTKAERGRILKSLKGAAGRLASLAPLT